MSENSVVFPELAKIDCNEAICSSLRTLPFLGLQMIIFVVGTAGESAKAVLLSSNQLLLFACRYIQLLPFHSHLHQNECSNEYLLNGSGVKK